MVVIRNSQQLILNMIDFLRILEPDLDTSPGSVARDLMIETPAAQLSLLYDELSAVSNQQSLRLVVGSDLDKLAQNYRITRKQATPSSGIALLTFSAINTNININRGDTVIASNGFSFAATSGTSITPGASNFYRSVASKFRDQLDFAGISDQYAVEITVSATTSGTAGNIGSYAINRTNISGVSNATNVNAFNGGTDQENDALFRNRILAAFSGSSVGTALGYLNVALGTNGVQDATVVEPGSVLMTRDGTEVKIGGDGTRTIVSEGSGGKVDVVVLGSNLVENTDSYIYQDKSNVNDPTNTKNNVILGQILSDAGKSINKKRVDDIKNGVLPAQPVDSILQVSGSISGSNFTEKSIDEFGRVSGNFELLKDTGIYGGSPWGLDTFHWISNHISAFGEDRIKGQANGQDALTFPEVMSISKIQQNLSITNENSLVSSTNKSILQLLHTPVSNVTRVFNSTTGERYIVINQNFDQTGIINTTGRIQISGNTLPSSTDILQVDYTWIVSYDPYSDYDGLNFTQNARTVDDSIDWGYANEIRNEKIDFELIGGNNFFQGTASHPVSSVISAKKFLEVDGIVSTVSSGTFVNRKCVILNALPVPTSSVDSVFIKNTNKEIFSSAQGNGTFTNVATVIGSQVFYMTTVILPSDTGAQNGDNTSVILNGTDVFNLGETNSGSSNGNQITIPSSLVNVSGFTFVSLLVSYIANVSDLFSASITSLPASHVGNGYLTSDNKGFQNFSQVNMMRREGSIIQQNLSSQFFVQIDLPSTDYSLDDSQIVSIVRLSDSKQLWTSEHLGNITTGNDGNFQIILDGYNTPTIGDDVLVFYYATDLRRFQPFSYSNDIINTRVDALVLEPDNEHFSLLINKIIAQGSNIHFSVIDGNIDGYNFLNINDGYMTVSSDGSIGNLSSVGTHFTAIFPDLINKKIKITGANNINNNGIYDILSVNVNSNIIQISNTMKNLTADQISVIRLLDGQELWSYNGQIDTLNNKIIFPKSSFASSGDSVFISFFNFQNLRKGKTKLIATISDQVSNNGVVTVSGTTMTLVQDVVFTATNSGLKLNLSEALKKSLKLNSSSDIPSNIRIGKILRAEKVETISNTSDEVLSILTVYDILGTTIQNNLFFLDQMCADSSFLNLDFMLPSTQNNTLDIQSHNIPVIGDKIRVSFYYVVEGDQENLSYTRNGTLYSNKNFVLIDKIYVSSGFKNSLSSKFNISSFTQPGLGSRYKSFYDYLAPKPNERISIRYNYNRLLSDVSFNIENSRPINADVLAREAQQVLLDLTINIVISASFKNSTSTVLQNLRDKLTSTLTTNILGDIIDTVDIINAAESIQGIDRARIIYFNQFGKQGSITKFQAQEDQYFTSHNLIINMESR